MFCFYASVFLMGNIVRDNEGGKLASATKEISIITSERVIQLILNYHSPAPWDESHSEK